MIASLTGTVQAFGRNTITIAVNGVGYLVYASRLTMDGLRRGEEVFLLTETIVREDALELVGFAAEVERELYTRLTKVQGVGRAVALALLSLDIQALLAAIRDADTRFLTAAPGVGPRLAQRIATDLAGKLGDIDIPAAPDNAEARRAITALEAMGLTTMDAARAVRRAAADGAATTAEMVRASLIARQAVAA